MPDRRHFFFAGGGTGGHIYPALAVAEALRDAAPDSPIEFLCSTRPIDRHILEKTPFKMTSLPATGLQRHPAALWRFLKTFHASAKESRNLLRQSHRPVVVGTGGFVTGPVCWAAQRLGLPIVLINVDSVAGKANKLAGRWARDIFLQYDSTAPAFSLYKAKLHTVGCPLRREFLHPDPQRMHTELGLATDKRTLLITGASSGAQHINEAVLALLDQLKGYADSWQIIHLTGHNNYASVRDAYRVCPLSCTVLPYCERMADLLATADLLIGRAGAVSVAEYAAAGVPAICLPYPFHADRHQYLNAERLVRAEAAVIVDDVPDVTQRSAGLWQALEPLLNDPEALKQMAANARQVACPQAAEQIARALLALP